MILFLKASKSDSHKLTPEAKAEFDKKYQAMDNNQKWKIQSGVYVENIMYNFGKKCTHEQ